MKTKVIEVKTGFGYYKNANGDIVGKAKLPIGVHRIADGYTYHAVDTLEEYEAIKIAKRAESDNARRDRLITERGRQIVRQMAIQQLTAEGKL